MEERRAISVTALTRYIKKMFDANRHLQDLWLRAEISNFKKHSRGHMYMTLKDANARIAAVMFAQDNRWLSFEPEDGMKVYVRGDVSVYEPYGQYQFYIKEMLQDGVGNLYLAFEALKKKLEKEGLFDPAKKKPLPTFPRNIGIITSPTGAAIRDLFTTIKRRFPAAQITVYPVLVQGANAAPSIAQAIRRANEDRVVDVLIVGRGGGSIEELWAFNEEIVAREIFASELPVISAVGHETDFTIADFVADLRAATPTAAGELVVPNRSDVEARLNERTARLVSAVKRRIEKEKERLRRFDESYAFRQPRQILRQKEQDLDRALERLTAAMTRHVRERRQQIDHAGRLLSKHHPRERALRLQKDHAALHERLTRAMSVQLERRRARMQSAIGQLNALSPLGIMERGYALPYKSGALVHSVKTVSAGDPLDVRVKDGWLFCRVLDVKEGDKNDGQAGRNDATTG